MNKLYDIIKSEFRIHKWEYLSFSIVVFISFLSAFISSVSGIDKIISYITDHKFVLSREIRLTPLEHFAPDTLAYGTASLYLFVAIFRIFFGVNEKAVTIIEKYIIGPVIKFYTILCRAIIGGLSALSILSLLFDSKNNNYFLFIFACIYPILCVFMVYSFKKLLRPIPNFKIDNGFLGSRFTGLLMILLVPISITITYFIRLAGKYIM